MNFARKAVMGGHYAAGDFTARARRSATPRSGFVQQPFDPPQLLMSKHAPVLLTLPAIDNSQSEFV